MKERQVTFASGALKLEGLLAIPEGSAPARAGIVCHPHPLYGGSMYNNVVDAVLEAMWKLGWATLRFNFRGVGRSEGEHGGGAGEADDATAAVKFIGDESGLPASAITLAGYSFGAMAATAAAPRIGGLGALMLVALPLRMADPAALKNFAGPIMLLAGDQDMYCPAPALEALQKELGARAKARIIEGADHFFGGLEEELAAAAESMLKTLG